MKLEVLKEIGLTESEIKVYVSLLGLGKSTTGPIVKNARISSSKIYEILEKLINKGLVSFIKNGNTKEFEATKPERILDLIKQKEQDLEQKRKEVEKLLPELTRKKELSKLKENAGIYKGMKGLETVFYESLSPMKKGETMYVIGIPSRSEKVNRFFVKFNNYRSSLGINSKEIFDEKARGELQTIIENKELREMKYLPETVVTPAAINILGDRTIIFPEETSEHPLIILIENKQIAESFKAQFNLLWNQQSITLTGPEGASYVLNDVIRTLKEGEYDLVFGMDQYKNEMYQKGVLEKYYKELEKKKLKEKIILKAGTKIYESKASIRKYLPKEYFNPIHYEIYGNKVAMINWDYPITTIITENKAMAENFKTYFNNLWKIAKEK